MCGIIGIISKENVYERILSGLKSLEYRGYDSAGIAVLNKNKIYVHKQKGKVRALDKFKPIKGNIGIGHTRWATHGLPEKRNAHPHLSYDKNVAVVHNGIIENYQELKTKYLQDIEISSDTDTEIIAHLLAKFNTGNNLETLKKVTSLLKGSYALACIFACDNFHIYACKKGSPMIVSQDNNSSYVCSDINSISSKEYFVLNDDEFVRISNNQLDFYDFNLTPITKEKKFTESILEQQKTTSTIMESEIDEIPSAILRLKEYYEQFSFVELKQEFLKAKAVEIIGCGSAYHSALIGELELEKALKKPIHSYIASEFKYRNIKINKDYLYIFVSQSGETADTIYCAEKVKMHGAKTLALTNVPNSSLYNLCDIVLPLKAGSEKAVASTKAYICQLLSFIILKDIITGQEPTKNLFELAETIKRFNFKKLITPYVKECLKYNKIMFIGRLSDYVSAMEASLKMKEITYINSLAISSGELKHGTLALVDEKTLIFAFSTQNELKDKDLLCAKEIISRNGQLVFISPFITEQPSIQLPKTLEKYLPIISIIPFEYLALKLSEEKGYNPDMPRNLAKCVTVE